VIGAADPRAIAARPSAESVFSTVRLVGDARQGQGVFHGTWLVVGRQSIVRFVGLSGSEKNFR
jgi:hypothetical protein